MGKKVFVYGTLLSGQENHRLLLRSCLVSAAAQTMPEFELVDLGAFPALVDGGRTAVAGEVYDVDDATLERLDSLESHPTFYERRKIRLADGTSALAYFGKESWTSGRPRLDCGDWRLKGVTS